jgi:hypothetical protein
MISKIFIHIKYQSGNIIIFFLPQGERKPLTFFVGVDNKQNPHLSMDPDSMILFVSIAESWVESVLKKMAPGKNLEEIKKSFIQDNKICPDPKCRAVNNITDKFCHECGIAIT